MKKIINYEEFIVEPGTTYWDFILQELYADCNYKVEVDFIGHTTKGGILIGGNSSKAALLPEEFLGYACLIDENCKKVILGCYNKAGRFDGNIATSDDVFMASDIHLSVEVNGNELTYRVTSIDGLTQYYVVNYTIGTSERDIYDEFCGKIGIYNSQEETGFFENLKITVYKDDITVEA